MHLSTGLARQTARLITGSPQLRVNPAAKAAVGSQASAVRRFTRVGSFLLLRENVACPLGRGGTRRARPEYPPADRIQKAAAPAVSRFFRRLCLLSLPVCTARARLVSILILILAPSPPTAVQVVKRVLVRRRRKDSSVKEIRTCLMRSSAFA